jgi:hypothetical protein
MQVSVFGPSETLEQTGKLPRLGAKNMVDGVRVSLRRSTAGHSPLHRPQYYALIRTISNEALVDEILGKAARNRNGNIGFLEFVETEIDGVV